MYRISVLALVIMVVAISDAPGDQQSTSRGAAPALIRTAKDGPWSSRDTWEGGKPPAAGSRVQIRSGHKVTCDVRSDVAIRSIHVAGTLTFARDSDTLLTVGLIKIQAGDDASEDGFNCDAHAAGEGKVATDLPRPALEIGTPNEPIPAGRTAIIRLAMVEGLDKETCPAVVCCGGRLDVHGASMPRTWMKLGATASVGDDHVRLAEPATAWRVGDRVIITSTGKNRIANRDTLRKGATGFRPRAGLVVITKPSGDQGATQSKPDASKPEKAGVPKANEDKRATASTAVAQTEERTITAIEGERLTLDKPLAFRHAGAGDYRGEVANLSRNVVIESADPNGSRGHTMYHRHSAGSISYAEFRHLGKEGLLGKYPIHYHLCGDTMRGSSVVGVSVWDSHNRWVVVHGTQYLVVRDCVGYQSVGHGFYLEDGTEVFNVLDRNLGVQAYFGNPLPEQTLPADRNDGAAFWWANNLNTFTRNVATECDRWGFLFDIAAVGADVRRPMPQADGTTEAIDIRTLPFVRFEDNEAHDHLDGVSLGGRLGGFDKPVAGDPLVLRNVRIWNSQWAFTPFTRYAVDNLDIADCIYGLFLPAHDTEVRPQSRDGKDGEVDWGRISFRRTALPIHLPSAGPPYFDGSFDVMEFAGDHQPPSTVITHSRSTNGKLVVRGMAADDERVQRVTVNGKEAQNVARSFGEWEVTLDVPADGRLTARAVDVAGNEEPRPHVVAVDRGGLRTIVNQSNVQKPTESSAVVKTDAKVEGLAGKWRVVSQQRAGRPTARPSRLTWEHDGGTIALTSARNSGYSDPLRRGARIPCRLVENGPTGQIDIDRKVSISFGIYKLEGDTLTLCIGPAQQSPAYDPNAKPNDNSRPTEFNPEAGTLIVLKR